MLAGGVSRVRADISHGQGFTEIVFRRSGRWKAALLLGVALLWLLGGGFAMLLLAASAGEKPMLVIWLALWGPGGFIMLMLLLWRLVGREALVVRSESLALTRSVAFLRLGRAIPAAALREIAWLADDPGIRVRVNGRRIPQSALELVEDGRRTRCAHGIGEAEAHLVIAAIRRRLVTGRGPR